MTARYPDYRYLGLEELGDSPHIIVDGAKRPHTTLVLSHWPASPTPEILWRDLSAEIASAYLGHPEFWDRSADVVSNDHPDIDGLISLFFLTNPAYAMEHATLLIDVARIGDFGVVRSRDAAQIAWILEALMDAPELITAELVDSEISKSSSTTLVYRSLLAALPRIIENRESYRSLYQSREELFDKATSEISSGTIALEEFSDVELAVFHVDHVPDPDEHVGRAVLSAFDGFALHTATSMPRILIGRGRRFVYYDRYETWVRFVSRRYKLRRDLGGLAKTLSDGDNTTWHADAPNTLEPVMWHDDVPSDYQLSTVVDYVTKYLATAPVAWDPFRSGGPLLPSAAAGTQTN